MFLKLVAQNFNLNHIQERIDVSSFLLFLGGFSEKTSFIVAIGTVGTCQEISISMFTLQVCYNALALLKWIQFVEKVKEGMLVFLPNTCLFCLVARVSMRRLGATTKTKNY